MKRATFIAVALWGAAACQKPPVDAPEAAYQAFATAVRTGDSKGAYAALSKSTQTAIEARAARVAEASKGLVKNEPGLMIFQAGVRPQPVGEVKVLSTSADRAVLEVTTGGRASKIEMVRDEGRWAVDLLTTFKADP